jgi:hypothetical protein
MELTSIEAIAQKLEDDRKQRLESILMISGSEAVVKNKYNITVVDDTNVASSLLFKELKKDKYDEEELLKAIDVNVTELKPNIPKLKKDLVPKPLYDEEVKKVEDLRREVERLNLIQTELSAIISGLEADVLTITNEKLVLDQTNDVLVNQSNTLGETINDFAAQIQTALQKSVEESILRASLQAQNSGFKAQIEALIKQIDSLNAIMKGLQSQLGAVQNQSTIIQSIKDSAVALGAEVVNKVGLVSFNPKAEGGKPIVYFAVNNKDGDNQFKYGNSVSITNNDRDPISVEINAPEFLYVPKTKYTISPSQTEKLDFKLGKLSYKKNAKSTNKAGQLTIKIIRNDGSSESKTYNATVNIQHKDSYPSW